MTVRNHIVCVEWSSSVDAVDLLRRSSTAAHAIGPETVYLIEHGGSPLYCGCTKRPVPDRLRAHWDQRTKIGKLLRRLIWNPQPVTVRWTCGGTALEAQVIHALLPQCNKLSAKHLRLTGMKARRSHMRAASGGNRPKLTAEQREEICRRVLAGEKKIAIAAEFGVSPATVTLAHKRLRQRTPAPVERMAA